MADAAYERLRGRIIERAEHWEADADDAEFAGNSYRGEDDEIAVDYFRSANRSRARARELRSLLDEEAETNG